ncbi:hypothetical protein GYMLUDRAFT_43196 [Collybiopsis luxurians FD-317 M1]|uniref:Uncharacterized protein n=1 Tax=Collybiopsis luxurians FD-317 M1 TaxID=944289 RepID=A0A0D0CEU5_9AGAR|nr:hypothetical protein GYMLUDRAFT_43196 [Collybiopsis luxurians FD-317 M1]
MFIFSFALIFVVLTWLSFWSTPSPEQNFSPKDCLSSTNGSLDALITCLDAFTVPPDFYDVSTYEAAQPTKDNLAAWKAVIWAMLEAKAGDCSDVILPDVLKDFYAVTRLFDSNPHSTHCVLSETTSFPISSPYQNHTYAKGWGLFVVPASPTFVSRNVHLSAPHPQADIETPQQAAAIFTMARARSLLISGRFRSAFGVQTGCIIPSNPRTVYYKTDPAHDVNEPFNVANGVIRRWQISNGGCPSETCAYVQMHGKGHSTCPDDTVFISSGLGTSSSSIAWYQNETLEVPARRLRDAARTIFLSSSTLSNSFENASLWRNISLPSDSPSCKSLTATTNVFGRLINGVPEDDVCTTAAKASSGKVRGEFVHIEQAIVSRQGGTNGKVYQMWAEVFRRTWRGVEEN